MPTAAAAAAGAPAETDDGALRIDGTSFPIQHAHSWESPVNTSCVTTLAESIANFALDEGASLIIFLNLMVGEPRQPAVLAVVLRVAVLLLTEPNCI